MSAKDRWQYSQILNFTLQLFPYDTEAADFDCYGYVVFN